MSENTSIFQVPISSKTPGKQSKETQKLVYVHIPKDKNQDFSHVKVLPQKSTSGSTNTASFVSLTGKINSMPVSSGYKKGSTLPTSFTFTKTTKIMSGSNITFSPRPIISSVTTKSRPPILGNKIKLSSASPNSALSSTPNISGNKITVLGSSSSSMSPLICSSDQGRSPSILSQVSPKQPKSVILQSKILTGLKPNSSKVVSASQKILPSLPGRQAAISRKPVVSYGNVLPSGASDLSGSSDGVKRDSFGTPKREGGSYNSFTPPPLILQSGSNAKKLANKKAGPTTISIVTGKSSTSSSGISLYPLSRAGNLTKSNTINFKISNGQIQHENSIRLDGLICDSRPVVIGPSLPNAETSDSTQSEDESGKDSALESTTFFRRAPSSVSRKCEQKDILQEAMSAMATEEEAAFPKTTEIITKSNSESNPPLMQMSKASNSGNLVSAKKSDFNFQSKVSQPVQDSIPVLLSNSVPVGGTPVLLQGTVPVGAPSALTGAMSAQGFIPVNVQHNLSSGSTGPIKTPEVHGLIIQTDSVTIRRKVGKEEPKKESSKPELSIIPILRNSSLDKSFSPPSKMPKVNLVGGERIKEGRNETGNVSVEEKDTEENKVAESAPDKSNSPSKNEELELEDKKSQEVKELLNWENGTGSLIGSNLKFTLNEFDAVELVEDNALDEIKNQITLLPNAKSYPTVDPSAGKEIPPTLTAIVEPSVSASPKLPLPTVHIHHARKPNLNRKEDEISAESSASTSAVSKSLKSQYDICCCKNCGCYGLSSEFFREKGNSFCTIACSEDYITKEAEWNKEKQRLEKCKNRLKKTKPNDREITEKSEAKPRDTKEEDAAEPVIPVDEEASSPQPPVKEEEPTLAVEETIIKFQHPWQDSKNSQFSWVKYLEHCGKDKGFSRGAPLKLWSEPFPFGKNLFKTGMKLEGIDPQHPALFCVMTVVDVVGHRIRLHFDGYSEMYDFWCNANSTNIFQIGWCEKNSRKLETPPGIFNFSWKAYLDHCQAIAAPKQAFATRNCTAMTPPSNFRIGMKLEAEDRKNGWTCVATVSDLLDCRILVHFDGWERAFDTWFDITSPFIHPIGWCAKNDVYLYPPKDYSNSDSFNWHEYLQETNSMGVPARAFKTRSTREFKVDMKVEAVDKRNPMLIRVASIAETKDFKLLLHFDGWPDMYDYWVDDDSPDIHPPTWCSKTGHPLQPPLTPEQCAEDVDSGVGCGTPGCKGYGHVKGLIYNTHHTAFGCPYSLQNLNKDWESLLPDRLDPPSKDRGRKVKGSKLFINLDVSKPIPEHLSEESQRKRVRKRRKFFDELSPPEGASKPKICRVASEELSMNKSQQQQCLLKSSSMPAQSTNDANPGPSTSSSSASVINQTASSFDGNQCKKGSSECKKGSSEVSVDTMVHQSIFNPGYHPNPPLPLPYTLERHKHIISGLKQIQRSELDSWCPEEVRDAISKIPGCEKSSEKFFRQDIDGESLLMLTQNDLVDLLGIKLGPAIKIMGLIFCLKNIP